MKATTLKAFLDIMKPGELITVRQCRERMDAGAELTRKHLDELVAAGLVKRVVIEYPGVKHRPQKRAKVGYILCWRQI